MKNFVCWRDEMVDQVMDTEALQPSRAVFLATHHPIRMYRASNVRGGPPTPYDERRFLADFLKPSAHAFAAVLGESGTGKSHLIRWLDLNLPRKKGRRVLLIPKVGTNLKNIIRQILEGMEGPRFDEYRRRLDDSSQDVSETGSRLRLLSNLAIAVGEGQTRDRQPSRTEQFLIKSLPDFLLDPVFRAELLKDGARIHELVMHALGRGDRVERLDKPREFTVADIPLEGITELANASATARRTHGFLLADEEMVKATVSWLNDHVSVAIRELLNMGGENLLELMLDVREALAEQGVELVLLIEDFAKLQGIDRQLLEALLTRESQPGRRPLCALRTALAVTTGYFERLEDTVKTRVTFRVDMDVTSTEKGGLVTADDVELFAARYLNAIRLQPGQIESWATQLYHHAEEPIPNACDGCQHRPVCHASFGERGGLGLYPFNAVAISRAADRVSDAGRFNPRVLINRVMRETFDKYTRNIREGTFPPPSLQQQFGRSRLPALVVNELRKRDPSDWERRQALLDLWTEGQAVLNLPAGVHEAFSLPPLAAQGEAIQSRPRPISSAPEPEPDDLPEKLAQHLRDLDDWQNKQVAELKQPTANALRPLVFRAVTENIDWDAEFLLKGKFAGGAGCLFQQRYIEFSNKASERTGTFRLTVPVEPPDLTQAALALQGLLLYEHHGHWRFSNGGALRRAYARQLERWGANVLAEVRRPTSSGVEWDPVPALVEVLSLGARLHGLPAKANPEVVDYAEALFAEWDRVDGDTHRAPEWRELGRALYGKRKELIKQLVSRTACTKGGGTKVQIVDASQIARPLRNVRDEWRLVAEFPEDASRDFGFVSDLRSRIASQLEPAVAAEQARNERWAEGTQDVLGDAGRDELVKALRDLVEAAQGAALSPTVRALEAVIDGFPSKNTLKVLKETMARLSTATSFADRFVELSRPNSQAMAAIEALVDATNQYMAGVQERIESRARELDGAGGEALDVTRSKLATALDSIEDLLRGEVD